MALFPSNRQYEEDEYEPEEEEYDDGFDELNEEEEPEPDPEEKLEKKRDRFRLAVGATNLIAVIGGTVAILVLLTLLLNMIYFVITSESTPTEIRASVVGSMQLLGMFGTGLNMLYNALVTMIAGSMNLPFVLTASYLPLMAISLIIMMWKVKETKDVDLDNVRADAL